MPLLKTHIRIDCVAVGGERIWVGVLGCFNMSFRNGRMFNLLYAESFFEVLIHCKVGIPH